MQTLSKGRQGVSLYVGLAASALMTIVLSSNAYAYCGIKPLDRVTPEQQICFNECYSNCALSGHNTRTVCNPTCAAKMLRGVCNWCQ